MCVWPEPCTAMLRIAMLKITAVETDNQRTLVLEGKLTDPWLAELERMWNQAREASQDVTVDLRDVTAISESGQTLLRKMRAEGATFRCSRGVLTRHVVEQVMECESPGSRGGANA